MRNITQPNHEEIINSLMQSIAVLDFEGTITSVNDAWVHFGIENGMSETYNWIGVNYFAICEQEAQKGEPYSTKFLEEVSKILANEQSEFLFEYPCHSHRKNRWFMIHATFFRDKITHEAKGIVISHINITKRKLAELELEKALETTKTLKGLIPICASCKSIRDDHHFWNKIESFIEAHTEIEFTHDLCPHCLNDLMKG